MEKKMQTGRKPKREEREVERVSDKIESEIGSIDSETIADKQKKKKFHFPRQNAAAGMENRTSAGETLTEEVPGASSGAGADKAAKKAGRKAEKEARREERAAARAAKRAAKSHAGAAENGTDGAAAAGGNGSTGKKPRRGFPIKKAKKKTAEIPEVPVILTPVDPETGLTEAQVSDRVRAGKVNRTDNSGTKTTGQIIRSHTLTYFNFLNIFLGVLVFLTGQYKNMLFLGVIVCNTLIGIFQELRVKQMIDKLSVITAAKADVLRGGSTETVPVEQVVLDDIILIRPGDQLVADGQLIAGTGIEVNESMLTGESKPVKKKPGDRLMSGSFVVAGTGRMQATQVGNDCYAAQLVAKTKKRHRASSEMQNTIQKIIKVVSVAIIPIGLLLYRSQYSAALDIAVSRGYNAERDIAAIVNGVTYDRSWIFSRAVVRTVTGVLGMIPEGLVLLTSVSFIIGVGRLAMKRALVQEMEAIEALARADILCTDKTGTITTGELEVVKLIAVGRQDPARLRSVISHMNGAFEDANDTQKAMDRHYGRKTDWTVRDAIPFSSERKFKAASFAGEGDYLIGAPEFLVPENRKVLDYVAKYSAQGYRVLLLASSDGISSETENKGNVTPMAIVVISDIIKDDAKEVFEYFGKAGVQVKVISGDNPATVSAVAVKAGVKGADRYVDANTLPTDDPARLAEEIEKYNVFGRVKPEQKQAFVHAWQEKGHTVAMVGDGVNDVLAIKDADCGIAMAKGSEAAKQAAHIVLLDSDFSSMKDIVQEGKTIICNIERVSALYLTKTIYSTMLNLIFIIIASAYPWTTLQLGLINVTGIGMPSFLLTLERHDDWKAEGFLPHVLRVCLPAALTMVTTILMIQLLNVIFPWDDEMFSFFNLMLGGLVAMLVVAQVCWPLNGYRRFILIACIAVFIAAIVFLPRFYDIAPLWTPWSFLLIPLGILCMMMIYWYSRWTNRLMAKFYKPKAERLNG